MNILPRSPDEQLSRVFRALGSPNRFRILAAIGYGESCVCHLEAMLDLRQAYISQQLMDMREAEIVDTRRDGRYVFYRLTQPQLLDILVKLSRLFEISIDEVESLINSGPLTQCCCPECIELLNPSIIDENKIQTSK